MRGMGNGKEGARKDRKRIKKCVEREREREGREREVGGGGGGGGNLEKEKENSYFENVKIE